MKTSKVDLYINGTLVNTHPIYPDDISIETERESGEMYRRTNISSTLTFLKADFDAIYNASIDASFEVRFYDAETNTFLARGTFEKTDCKFNLDDRICEVKVSSADDYDKILNGKGNEYDLVSLAPVRESVTLTKRAILQIYVHHDSKITNVIGNMSYEVNVAGGIDVDDLTPTDLERDYNFTQISSGTSQIVVSKMPTGFTNLEGTYNGSYNQSNPQSSVFTQQGGTNKIVVESEIAQGGITYYYWVFKDSNNVIYKITTGAGQVPICTRPSNGSVPSPVSWGFELGHKVSAYISSWVVDHSMSAAYYENSVFARVLMAEESRYYPELTKKVLAEDICETNLNYNYSVKVTTDWMSALPNVRVSSAVQDEPTKWGVNGDGKYFVQPSPLASGDNVIPIGWNRWIPYSIWLESTTTMDLLVSIFDVKWTLKDAYPLWSAIDVLLQKIDPTIRFDGTSTFSQFLYGYISSSVIHNWVSQLLYLTPITNVKKTYYNQAARKGTITLEQILNMLKSTCQLYWFIDEDKRLRIEHITWFKNGGNYAQATPIVDLTAIKSPMSKKPWAFNENTIEYDKSLLTKRYEFGWASETSEAFDGYPINIHNGFVKEGNTESTSVANFISDIDLIISSPDSLPDDCFALIGTDANKYCPFARMSNLSMDFVCPTYNLQNPYLSFHFLELAYWNYDLGGNYATLEGLKTSQGYEGMLKVYGTKRIKKQSVKFPIVAGNVGKEGLIKTDLGNGEWVKSKYTLEDGMTEMDLIYDTADTSLVSIGEVVKTNSLFTYVASADGITFRGNNTAHNGVIYAFITANRNVWVQITANSETEIDFGWANTSPLSVVMSNTPATAKISGDANMVTINMDKGDSLFFGYYKDEGDSEYGDQISVRFYAR